MNTLDSRELVADYQADGVVVVRGIFSDWIETLCRGATTNIESPGPRAIVHRDGGQAGRFIEDFCNFKRISEYREFVFESPMVEAAATLMQSDTVQFFHDHLLHKEAQGNVPTPWHQDMPYYCVDGQQNASFWIPLNHVPIEASLRCIAGSHLWPEMIRPESWSSNESFYSDDSGFVDMPSISEDDERIRAWEIEPGDAVAFNFRTVHSAGANNSTSARNTISFRVLGADARFIARPGPTSPNFPQIGLDNGARLRQDWFPMLKGP